ncbi:MAG: YceI family protein [Balneola sp.]
MKTVLITILGVLTSFSVTAQNAYPLNNESSTVVIKGTSSLHDWESKAESIEATLTAVLNDEAKIENISELILTIDVESIESGKTAMNKKVYSAFDSDKHPKIVFTLSGITQIKQDSIFATGVLAMAGKEQTIDLVVTYQTQKDHSIKIAGSKTLLMTDYGMKPPKAMLGTLKTGDEIEIVFDVIFQKN